MVYECGTRFHFRVPKNLSRREQLLMPSQGSFMLLTSGKGGLIVRLCQQLAAKPVGDDSGLRESSYCIRFCDVVRTLLSLPQERQDRDIAPAVWRDLRRG